MRCSTADYGVHNHLSAVRGDTSSIGTENHGNAVSGQRLAFQRPQVMVIQACRAHANINPLTGSRTWVYLPNPEATQWILGIDTSGIGGKHAARLAPR